MTVSRIDLRSFNWPVFLTFALPVGCLVWAFGNTLGEMEHAWYSPQSSHGFLVPFFALYLLWHRRSLLARATPRPSWLGLPLVAAGIGLHLYGAYYNYIWIDHIALLPTLAGVWLTCGGWLGFRWGWPSILFLVFMIPLPYRYAIALSGPLQRLATVVSTFIMQCCGMPALAEGNSIKLNDFNIDVVEACSGLRMLVVFAALSTAVVLLCRRHWLDKVILLLSAIPIALVSNITRIIVTGVLFELVNDNAVNAWVHDTADWLMMPFALGLLWVELKLLDRLFIQLPAPMPRGTRSAAPRRNPQSQPQQLQPARKRVAVPVVQRVKRARPPAPRPNQVPTAAAPRKKQAPPTAAPKPEPAPTGAQPAVETEEAKR